MSSALHVAAASLQNAPACFEPEVVSGSDTAELAEELLSDDALVKAGLHDSVAIHTIRHFGRRLPAELRTALDLHEKCAGYT